MMRNAMKLAALTALSVGLAGCGVRAEARPGESSIDKELLQGQGYVDIRLKGWAPFKCGKDDNPLYTDVFEARTAAGAKVKGVICGAMFKGRTIRFY